MKRILYIAALLAALVSCVGQKDDPVMLVLSVDRSELNVPAGEEARFTVLSNGEDVTEYSEIQNITTGETLSSRVFSPEEEGAWNFVATYDGFESAPVSVTAFVPHRRSLLLEFTATWCVNCPRMEAAVAEAMETRPGRIVPVCVHFADAMASPAGNALVTRFKVQAYPSVVIDLDGSTLFTAASPELIYSSVDKLLEARPKAAEIKVRSSVEGLVNVEVTAAEAGSYEINVMLLEDGVVAAQIGGATDHVHNNILRLHESSGPSSLEKGERMEYSAPLSLPKTESLKVVAFVTQDGIVNNVAVCRPGETSDYMEE